jgi:hypothetical protein
MGWNEHNRSGLGSGPVEGFCEHGNEPSGSIKCWEAPVQLGASQEGLSSMKLCIIHTEMIISPMNVSFNTVYQSTYPANTCKTNNWIFTEPFWNTFPVEGKRLIVWIGEVNLYQSLVTKIKVTSILVFIFWMTGYLLHNFNFVSISDFEQKTV